MEKGELGLVTRVLIWRRKTGVWQQAMAAAVRVAPARGLGGGRNRH
jgi:hypothetical protein